MIHPNSKWLTQATGQCAESPALTEQIMAGLLCSVRRNEQGFGRVSSTAHKLSSLCLFKVTVCLMQMLWGLFQLHVACLKEQCCLRCVTRDLRPCLQSKRRVMFHHTPAACSWALLVSEKLVEAHRQTGQGWDSASRAPYMLWEMWLRLLCTNTSCNQYILKLVRRNTSVPKSLPAYLFNFFQHLLLL